MKSCKNCGCELMDNAQFCEKCGSSVYTAVETQDSPATTDFAESKKHVKKKGGAVVGIITTIIAIIIGRLVGGFIGDSVAEDISKNKQINKIDYYIENMAEYIPGSLTDKEYVSQHFGLKFETNENWIMYTEEELASGSEGLKESTIAAGEASLKSQGASREIIEKWKSAIYAKTEMGAGYIVDDVFAGEVAVGVLSGYGMDGITSKEVVEQMKQEVQTMSDNISSGVETIAGESYDSLKMSLVADDIDMVNQIFIREKDGMICMITCKAVKGCEDEVFASFKAQLSKY